MVRTLTLVLVFLAMAMPAAAQVFDTASARQMLYPTRGHTIQTAKELSPQNRRIVTGIVPLMAKEMRQPVRYYTAIAWSPKDGMVHESLQAAMNHHSVEAAGAAAVAACNVKKSNGAPNCVVAARVVPKNWQPRPLMLSIDATAAFDKKYRRMRGSKAFSVSSATGAFGYGASDAAALARCGSTGAQDCKVVIRN
ncbi:hypothetical protein EF888_08360 [Silicimonas algicola]|uniref:5-aminolevulic acid synthase n=1 Tax=Silicimonas algicola TaxID=1826607 RepID=A0A316G7J2_9RHOB|nr:hypothetical protein [Silicimonas algicola]AZQ67142.1 hypothetical protein EF888_08360 [Silicimonas algicola]PWK56788.1 hypothetical protein C8D95_10319 [Silicimonas algicola]